MSGRGQLGLVGKVTTGMGLACFLLVAASSAGRDRLIVAIYAIVTTLVGLAFVVTGRTSRRESTDESEGIEVAPVSLVEE